jgi:hypothetical protein
MPMPDVGTKFSFYGNIYMIGKSKIDVANIGLFILSHVSIPPKQSVHFFHCVVLFIVGLTT